MLRILYDIVAVYIYIYPCTLGKRVSGYINTQKGSLYSKMLIKSNKNLFIVHFIIFHVSLDKVLAKQFGFVVFI